MNQTRLKMILLNCNNRLQAVLLDDLREENIPFWRGRLCSNWMSSKMEISVATRCSLPQCFLNVSDPSLTPPILYVAYA